MLPDTASSEQWRTFLQQCLAHRVDVDEFKDLTKLMLARSPVKENELLDLLLEARANSAIAWDPLLPVYVDSLCKVGQVKSASALNSLLKHSSIQGKEATKRKASTLMTDIKVIQDIMMAVSTGSVPRSIAEAADLYAATVEWIVAVVAWQNDSLNESQQTRGLMSSPDAVSLFESLGVLLAALSGTTKGLETLSSDNRQGMSCFGNSVHTFADKDFPRFENQAGSGAFQLSAFVC
jgi:mediator of RNA polymerase II transcription subunit 5